MLFNDDWLLNELRLNQNLLLRCSDLNLLSWSDRLDVHSSLHREINVITLLRVGDEIILSRNQAHLQIILGEAHNRLLAHTVLNTDIDVILNQIRRLDNRCLHLLHRYLSAWWLLIVLLGVLTVKIVLETRE